MTPEYDHQPPHQEAPLSSREQKLFDLCFQSFRFSQGERMTQKTIITWLAHRNFFTGLDIPYDPPSYIARLVAPKKHTLTSGYAGDPQQVSNIKDMWSTIHTEVHQPLGKRSEERLVDSVLSGMVANDRIYQTRSRPQREKKVYQPDSIEDPHASFIRKYALLHAPTGAMEFDTLFQEMTPRIYHYLRSKSSDDATSVQRKQLKSLQQAWEKNHPGQSFFPPQQK